MSASRMEFSEGTGSPKKPRRSGAAKWEERHSLAESSKCVQIDVAFIPQRAIEPPLGRAERHACRAAAGETVPPPSWRGRGGREGPPPPPALAGPGTFGFRVGNTSESLFLPITTREWQRHTDLGCLCLRSHNLAQQRAPWPQPQDARIDDGPCSFLFTVLRIEPLSRPASVRRPERDALPCSHGRKYPLE